MDGNNFASALDSVIEAQGTGSYQVKVITDTDTFEVTDVIWDDASNCFSILVELEEDIEDEDDEEGDDDDDE